jgi:hypothetical protein
VSHCKCCGAFVPMHATGVIAVHGQPLCTPAAAADEVMKPYDPAFTALAFATFPTTDGTNLPYVGIHPAACFGNCP